MATLNPFSDSGKYDPPICSVGDLEIFGEQHKRYHACRTRVQKLKAKTHCDAQQFLSKNFSTPLPKCSAFSLVIKRSTLYQDWESRNGRDSLSLYLSNPEHLFCLYRVLSSGLLELKRLPETKQCELPGFPLWNLFLISLLNFYKFGFMTFPGRTRGC